MTIYSFWIFDKHCNCIFNREWTLSSNTNSGIINAKQNEETSKLLYGVIFSLRSVTRQLSSDSKQSDIKSISTGKYRIHIYCTATGLWFILLSDFKQQYYTQVLQHIYGHIYVKYITHNLLIPSDLAENENEKRGQGVKRITNKNFIKSLETFLAPMIS
ncbi:hypothetical protein TBLA_0B06230 [Henningerozyma blattae CBS 6284]|uniref:Trafficking protein particle complex subunit n=1 Tax=Henningerozyma blattae (strain ATCC 34711 / CBS 6284 / DSM 70876 / NBRC 10599 / NRRL Y-10934 / UCD 77-7) TaxID=1071380 RepID=I2GZ96_HENB6|nr:hypothetical protein TBLA_0B06230 [Tetrapisispora blattae CBS 6284]CCH59448.1 hypothetical protein TBLA_0B06230 [Tetrapisispora blattae CBS 6284]